MNWLNAVLALLGMMFFQLSGNLLSDYHDYMHHVDKPGEESVQILTSGLFAKKEVLWYGICLLTVACGIGLIIFLRSGWVTLLIGGIGTLLSVFNLTRTTCRGCAHIELPYCCDKLIIRAS